MSDDTRDDFSVGATGRRIAELEAELDKHINLSKALKSTLDDLRKERDRYREALEKIKHIIGPFVIRALSDKNPVCVINNIIHKALNPQGDSDAD